AGRPLVVGGRQRRRGPDRHLGHRPRHAVMRRRTPTRKSPGRRCQMGKRDEPRRGEAVPVRVAAVLAPVLIAVAAAIGAADPAPPGPEFMGAAAGLVGAFVVWWGVASQGRI